ncbi:hypothetical protein PENTCL1PPCAC_23793, partial [Pristionchus entomophagus]
VSPSLHHHLSSTASSLVLVLITMLSPVLSSSFHPVSSSTLEGKTTVLTQGGNWRLRVEQRETRPGLGFEGSMSLVD